ncbi:MAG: ParB/RepB/Spo0J family partition protein [Eggerthellaceae bacterium]|nr:ParB/RepB/Spo0J family partition protein [Eggerthellaceae bacterium]
MAKPTKSGLGRGLNSLLSGSMEEASSTETVQTSTERTQRSAPKVAGDEEAKTKPVSASFPRTESETPPQQGTTIRATATDAGEKGAAQQEAQSETQPIVQSGQPVQPTPSEQPALSAMRPTAAKGSSSQKPTGKEATRPPFEEDDHVVIKGVKERVPDEVSITLVQPNPEQPRTYFKQDDLEELAASIEKNGLLQPVLVRSVGKHYQIIAGERRWQACKMLGMKTIAVRVHEADDDKALELALIENLQRSDLNPIEEAYGVRRLMERCGLSQSEVAETLSKGRSTVANALRLLELPEEAQQLLFEEKISAGHARTILSIPTQEGRQKLTERMINEKISVREAETIARLFAGPQGVPNAGARPLVPVSFKKAARSLREALQTNVRIKTVQGKNKIEIEFKDEEELEQLFAFITASGKRRDTQKEMLENEVSKTPETTGTTGAKTAVATDAASTVDRT